MVEMATSAIRKEAGDAIEEPISWRLNYVHLYSNRTDVSWTIREIGSSVA